MLKIGLLIPFFTQRCHYSSWGSYKPSNNKKHQFKSQYQENEKMPNIKIQKQMK